MESAEPPSRGDWFPQRERRYIIPERSSTDLASIAIEAGNPDIFEEHGVPYVERPGGRKLAIHTTGKPSGAPFFLLQGTPGSRLHPVVRSAEWYRRGACQITFDRPGFGDSDPQPCRTIADGVADMEAVADALGVDEFAVIGRSGGGVYALEAKARLGKRVRAAVVLGTIAPLYADVNLEAQVADNQRAYSETPEELRESRSKIAQDPHSFLDFISPGFQDTDFRIIQDSGIRMALKRSYQQGFAQGAEGWVEDIEAYRNWILSPIPDGRNILIWNGFKDPFALTSQSEWLHQNIPGSTLVTHPELSHFSALPVTPLAFAWAYGSPEMRKKVENQMKREDPTAFH